MANSRATQEAHFVIGGNGFLGSSIIRLLKGRGEQHVHVFDLSAPAAGSSFEKVTYHSGDITNAESLNKALLEASNANINAGQPGDVVIYHTASPVAGLGKDVYEKVNVQGTETVIQVAKELHIKKLVFTSSAGVLFTGEDLVNVDERFPYPQKAMDAYNDTKARAEQAVLAANDTSDDEGLRTCALRPAGIFGVNDRQALPGFFQVLATGRANMQIGDNENLFDWTYVDNVAHAHLLAADRLLIPRTKQYDVSRMAYEHLPPVVGPEEKKLRLRDPPTSEKRPSPPGAKDYAAELPSTLVISEENPLDVRPVVRNKFDQFFHHLNPEISCLNNPLPESTETNLARETLGVAGEAFFITNGQPIPFWDFPRALWAGVGTVIPDEKIWKLSKGFGMTLAGLAENVCWVLGKTSIFTRYRVTYTACARYYNIEKARRILDYEPIVGLNEGIKRSVEVSRVS
jgi:sterol-4alpha-carboxylate 3-dehydrogenase (decarboxylating)